MVNRVALFANTALTEISFNINFEEIFQKSAIKSVLVKQTKIESDLKVLGPRLARKKTWQQKCL